MVVMGAVFCYFGCVLRGCFVAVNGGFRDEMCLLLCFFNAVDSVRNVNMIRNFA
jgi:hypothetical protein